MTLALNAFRGDGAAAGPGETLTVRPNTPLTVIAEVAGAADSSLAIITDGGSVGRVKTDDCGAAKLAVGLHGRRSAVRSRRGAPPGALSLDGGDVQPGLAGLRIPPMNIR